MDKLQTLAEYEGFDSIDDLITDAVTDSVVAGICTNPHCDYTTSVEPDQDKGWCEECSTNTVASCLILAELI